MRAKLEVKLSPGLFSEERIASFEAHGRRYSISVDQSYIEGRFLLVQIIERRGNEVWVELPQTPLGSGARLKIPETQIASE